MSWFANLVKTYDKCVDIVGIPNAKGTVLLPIFHWEAISHVCITLDREGQFRSAIKSEENILIPVTENSVSRTSSANIPHPLHDKLNYLALNESKRKMYINQLASWKDCHQKVRAVYNYIVKGSIINDLRTAGIKKPDYPKLLIRFSVEIEGDPNPHLWEDNTIVQAWIEYCTHNVNRIARCYITGDTTAITSTHPRGIYKNKIIRNNRRTTTYRAKLISCNDDSNYTYRGRFTTPEQANVISSEASYKGLSMLKYLIATQGYICDSQAIVAYAIDDGTALLNPFEDSLGLFDTLEKTDADKLIETQGTLAMDYAIKLNNALRGLGNAARLKKYIRQIAVIAVDSAVPGRMGVTFYQKMEENEYIDRICDWHNDCKWYFWNIGKEYISAPVTDDIIKAIYGEPRGENYKKIQKQAREKILHCIVCGETINNSWISAAKNRVSSPFSYTKKDGGWDFYKWYKAIGITCALVRKYYIDQKEVFSMELEKDKRDRDYLYGRLLAIADKIESHARYLQTGKDDTEKRPTNAVRYMQRFAIKPFSTWNQIYHALNPYIQRLNGAEWYQSQIDEIMALFEAGDYEIEKSLSAKYLMGYSLQRRDLILRKEQEVAKDEHKQEN
jgi:CRISPR-associated protein Csd1